MESPSLFTSAGSSDWAHFAAELHVQHATAPHSLHFRPLALTAQGQAEEIFDQDGDAEEVIACDPGDIGDSEQSASHAMTLEDCAVEEVRNL